MLDERLRRLDQRAEFERDVERASQELETIASVLPGQIPEGTTYWLKSPNAIDVVADPTATMAGCS